MSEIPYVKLLDALELHQNILHAEKQAISARDLDTIEELLIQKDETLNMVLSAKRELSENYPEHITSRIDSVISLQRCNTQNFKKLHIQDGLNKPQTPEISNLFSRVKRAYS